MLTMKYFSQSPTSSSSPYLFPSSLPLTGPDAGILKTSVLAHVFKGKLFPQAYRKEYTELLGKFEVALILDRNRLLVPSMLPICPRYTIHAFRNLFPRPSLRQILAYSPDTPKLFGQKTVPLPTPSPSGDECSDANISSPDLVRPTHLSVASHVSEELCRTGLILRRLYFMTYVPSGFWPRLISRFLTSSRFSALVLQSLGFPEDQIKEISSQLISGQMNGAISIEWSYWRTGIELWYKGLSLLRVAEILPNSTFRKCAPSPSIFEQSSTAPIEPAVDVDDLSFELNGHWMPVDMTPNHGVEVLIPDTVCPARLQEEYSSQLIDSSSTRETPQFESSWMSAEILSLVVDYIDTLLEDWYPGLGARDGNKTVDSIPYVNRVVPCPFCVSGATPLVSEEEPQVGGEGENGAKTPVEEPSFTLPDKSPSTPNLLSPLSPSPLELPKGTSYRPRANDVFPRPTSPLVESRAKRSLFSLDGSESAGIVESSVNKTGERKGSLKVKGKHTLLKDAHSESHRQRSLSEKSPNRVLQEDKVVRQQSLSDLHKIRRLNGGEDSSCESRLGEEGKREAGRRRERWGESRLCYT